MAEISRDPVVVPEVASQGVDGEALTPVATLMKLIIEALVDYPEDVQVREFSGHMSTVIEVESAKRDLGKLVGRHGRTADSLRTLLVGFGGKANRRFILELLEPDRAEGRPPSTDHHNRRY